MTLIAVVLLLQTLCDLLSHNVSILVHTCFVYSKSLTADTNISTHRIRILGFCQCFSYIGTILCCSRAKQTNELLNRWEGISLILQLYEKWSSFNAILQTVKYNIILAFSFTTISTLALSHTLVATRIVFVVKA